MSRMSESATTASATQHDSDRIREGVTMALYIGFSLLAVLLATPTDYVDDSRVRVAMTLALTGAGLLLAHQLAFRLSTRLLNRGVLDEDTVRALGAQALGGLGVAAVAVAPVLIIGGRTGILVSQLLLLALVGAVGFLTARSSGATTRWAVLYIVGVILVVGALVAFKLAVKY
jgi:hypothetical protein